MAVLLIVSTHLKWNEVVYAVLKGNVLYVFEVFMNL